MKNNKNFLNSFFVIFSIFIFFIFTGCNNNSSDINKEPIDNQGKVDDNLIDENSNINVQNDSEDVLEFNIESKVEVIDGNFIPSFSLTQINVRKGDKIKLTIENTKGTHDFKLDEFNVFAETPEGEKTVVEFTADRVGSFTYYCSKPGHKAAGQFGNLIVSE